ncbi:zinc ABC transporter substrate-binding protein [bacterium]|nr:zinc ABC transporter substrate-binding protein [bacterium]
MAVAIAARSAAAEDKPFTIGVTLHPYYSFAANIAGDAATVVPVLPDGANPHSFQPGPDDVKRLAAIDVLIVNGLGHDEFIFPMLKAAGREDMPIVRANEGVATIKAEGSDAPNPHTFLSINASIRQVRNIARGLGKARPDEKDTIDANARAYIARLRKMLAGAQKSLGAIDIKDVRVATVHDGYAYLFRDLGLTIAAVVQPRHGIEPSAKQLADTVRRIREANVTVLFTEADYTGGFDATLREETGCRVYRLSHIAGGAYGADRFENDMRANLDTVVRALAEGS